ncbi:hypothetical protein AB7221_02140 [Providencia rettgeri]
MSRQSSTPIPILTWSFETFPQWRELICKRANILFIYGSLPSME